MESLSEYLFRSSVWLTGFGLIYFIFLRNERYFNLNRIFLLAGIISSLCFPLIQFHYTVVTPVFETTTAINPQPAFIHTAVEKPGENNLLFWLYFSGALFLISRLLWQTMIVVHVIRQSGFMVFQGTRIVRTNRYPAPFSFFPYVFVSATASETEIAGIIYHEQGHIRQKHWIDLILFELACVLQWFNPVVWLYGRLIRQNHEYLADQFALKHSQNPAQYRATLLNQLFNASVIKLSNSFGYSLNKKRFAMMKQTMYSPMRKLRLLWSLALVAGIFYAFATPEYQVMNANETAGKQELIEKLSGSGPLNPVAYKLVPDRIKPSDDQITGKQKVTTKLNQPKEKRVTQSTKKIVRGKVIDGYGNPMEGVSVVASRTNMTKTDAEGNFELDMTNDDPVSFTHEGLKTTWRVMPDFEKSTTVKMEPEIRSLGIHIVMTGVVKSLSLHADSLDKKANQDRNEKIYTVVNQMPEFPGGLEALRRFIANAVRYPKIAVEDGIQGQVFVRFVVNREGNIWNAKVVKPVHPALDQEAIRIIYSLPQWEPGVHHGNAVNVEYTVPISFSIN